MTLEELDLELDVLRLVKQTSAAPNAADLEAQGYKAWYAAIFGQSFVDVWEAHHEEAIRWHWETRRKLLRGEALGEGEYKAYLAIWSRGHMKSTIARRVAICDAALSATAKTPGYCLYVGGTDRKKDDHATSLAKLLERPALLRYYPQLGEIQKSARGHSQGDQKDFRYLATGYVIRFVSLDAGIAGGNVDDTRPTLIIPDDVDERGASAEKYANRALRFTTELLPMRQSNTLVFGAQNVIQRNTIFHQIYTGKIPALANRYPTKAIPAVRNLVTERRSVNGQPRDFFVSGESTWKAWDAERIQEEIDTMTLEAFLLECQHEVEARKTGLVLNKYTPSKHVITWSQFASVYGTKRIPSHWRKGIGHDWGNTHANVTTCFTTAAQNSALPGLKFIFAGITADPQSTVDDVAVRVIDRLAPHIDTRAFKQMSALSLGSWRATEQNFSKLLDEPRAVARKKLAPQVAKFFSDENFDVMAMSHEQKKICEVYNADYGFHYAQTNPGATGGITEINRDFEIDWSVPDPFRPDEMGISTLYLIVDDAQAVEATDDLGLKLWREQFLDWSYRETRLTLNGLSDDKPAKVHDDAGNSCMMFYFRSALQPAPLTKDERIQAEMPEYARLDVLKQRNGGHLSPADQLTWEFNRKTVAQRIEKASQSVWRQSPDMENWS